MKTLLTMKFLLAIIFFLFSTSTLVAQRVRLEGDNSTYLCLNDSLAATFGMRLKKNKIDSTIAILYDYDNGRLPNSRRILIWTHDGKSNIKLVEGCAKIIKDTTYLFNADDLWEYIRVTNFDDVTVPIKSGTGQSHDMVYHITVNTPDKSFFIVVRNNERKSSVKYKAPESDTRIMLTNKIDELFH